MKRFISLFLISCIFFGVFSQTFALPKAEPGTIVSYLQSRPAARYVSHSELFMTMVDSFGERMEIPRSYRHIDLQGSLDIATRDTRLYRAYQKAVYMDLIKIKDIPLRLSGGATHAKLIDLTERFFGEEVNGVMLVEGEKLERNNKKLRYDDLRSYVDIILTPETTDWAITKADGFDLLNDAYLKITTEHIDREKFVERDLMYGAIGGLAQATGDKYTTFFPPTESAGFNDSLNGEFEGIGAFVEMEKPGELMVISPIRNSPAEKWGMQGGDRITHVDGVEITRESNLAEVVGRIKWPTGSTVTLKVLRDGVSLTFVLTREKVKYDLVSSKKLGSNAFYIQVNSFGEGVSEEFTKAVDAMKKDGATRLILDLRNDPGGNVYEVSNMLDYFVPKGKSKLNIASLSNLESYYSEGKDAWFADKKVVVLINEGTASASEIMAGTMADYLESRIKIVGEKSYGKGSVQIVAPNADGSSLKYTVAKWFTGKHSRSIDHIGISPDIEVVYDEALWKSSKVDNQLEKALSIQF